MSSQRTDSQRAETAAAAAAGAELVTERNWPYDFFLFWLQILYALYFRRRLAGRTHLPQEGGVLIVANHQSFLDIPLIAIAARRHVAFVARDTLANFKPLGWLMRRCGAILVQRDKQGGGDRAALRAIQAHLQAGDAVAIFPEGTRSRDGSVGDFRGGVLVAARGSGAPLVPTGIRGCIDAWGRHARIPRPRRVSLEFGPPIDPRAPAALATLQEEVRRLAGDGRVH